VTPVALVTVARAGTPLLCPGAPRVLVARLGRGLAGDSEACVRAHRWRPTRCPPVEERSARVAADGTDRPHEDDSEEYPIRWVQSPCDRLAATEEPTMPTVKWPKSTIRRRHAVEIAAEASWRVSRPELLSSEGRVCSFRKSRCSVPLGQACRAALDPDRAVGPPGLDPPTGRSVPLDTAHSSRLTRGRRSAEPPSATWKRAPRRGIRTAPVSSWR